MMFIFATNFHVQ